VLIAEDERDLADGLARGLRREGISVEVVYDGAAALAAAATSDPDVMILDRDMPALSGDMVCSTLRAQHHPVRILMLTAAGTLDDRVAGLEMGADDYLPKPFAFVELLARIRALGRRVTGGGTTTILEAGDLILDPNRRTAERGGLPLRLTPKEFAVLEVLLEAAGAWVTSDELIDAVWYDVVDAGDDPGRGVLKTTIYTLRRKLGKPELIETSPGFGYRVAG
jgi:DNA-binding response OmpR family regulator